MEDDFCSFCGESGHSGTDCIKNYESRQCKALERIAAALETIASANHVDESVKHELAQLARRGMMAGIR